MTVSMDKEISEETSTLLSSPCAVQRDSSRFIHRLPVEILEVIFIHCALDHYSTAGRWPIRIPPSWVNVSYVSRHWRHVALNCSILWTHLFLASPRWTEELLARSKQAPLKLEVNLYDNRHFCFVEQVIHLLGRIQGLCLHLLPGFYQRLSKVSAPAPCLQDLRLLSTSPSPSTRSLSVRLFGGETPALRTLELCHCPVAWHSFKLGGSTDLRLRFIPVQCQQNTECFFATLNCMQGLKHLFLEMALGSAAGFLSSPMFHTFQKFSLPQLSNLCILAQPSTVVALLSCVNIPLKAKLRLDCSVEDVSFSIDHFTMLCSLFEQRCRMSKDQAPYSESICSLHISFFQGADADADIAFDTLEDNHCPVPDIRSDPDFPTFPFRIRYPIQNLMTSSHWEHIRIRMCCPIPMSNVQRLQISGPPLSRTFWTHILEYLPGLRYLELNHGRMPDIAPLLSFSSLDCTGNQSGRSGQGGHQMYAPALVELMLQDIQFSAAWTRRYSNMPDPFQAADIESLLGALSTRENARVRLGMFQCTELDHYGQVTRELDEVEGWFY